MVTDPAIIASICGSYDPAQEERARQECIDEVREQLAKRILHSASTLLTQKQFEIFTLWRQGKVQAEIAELVGVQQTSVQKALFGNVLYSKYIPDPTDSSKKIKIKLNPPLCYGGIMKKIKEWCESDTVCQQMQQTIDDLKAELMDPEDV